MFKNYFKTAFRNLKRNKGYAFIHQWLQNYTYRIHIGVTVFMMAIIGSMIIAWITVGHRVVKAAIANPVKSLRTE
jgi:hypothetical protein